MLAPFKKGTRTPEPSHIESPVAFQVKKMEDLGIGRPSTYASTMKVLQVIVSGKSQVIEIE